MRYRTLVSLVTCLMVSSLAAQSVPTPASHGSDSLAVPATASSAVSYRKQAVTVSKPSPSPFKFKRTERAYRVDQPPPSVMDKAAVMGKERPWQNGEPPVDCATSPHSAACRH